MFFRRAVDRASAIGDNVTPSGDRTRLADKGRVLSDPEGVSVNQVPTFGHTAKAKFGQERGIRDHHRRRAMAEQQ